MPAIVQLNVTRVSARRASGAAVAHADKTAQYKGNLDAVVIRTEEL
jgi:hypothetical protein